MLLCLTFTPRCKSLSGLMAFFAVSSLLFSGAESGLASQQLRVMKLGYGLLQKPSYTYPDAVRPSLYYYYIGTAPSRFEAFPVLQNLYTENNVQYFPYGGTQAFGSSPVSGGPAYPYQYYYFGSSNAGTIPDDWTQEDVDEINTSFNALTLAQKKALSGTVIAGNTSSSDGSSSKFFVFNTKTIGSSSSDGGVVTYGSDGVPVVSYVDNTGYASGYKQNPDGSLTPVYYTIDNGTVTEFSEITPPSYDNLTVDAETGNYSLSIPNYNKQLDKIINKLDTISFDNITLQVPTPEVTVNVPPPDVTVNPEINLTPDVTVNVPAPVVNVTLPDSVSSGLSQANNTLSNILDSVEGNASDTPEDFDDLTLTSEEQSLVSRYVDWETNLPLIGDALDVGLTTLLGRIPNVGTEYLWLDYTIGGGSSSAGASGRRSSSLASASNPLAGYNIRIDLINYRDILLGARGVMILFEALYFCMLTLKCIRQALSV